MEKCSVVVPLAPVRSTPADSAEMVTQFLFGEPVEILEKDRQWRKCRSIIDGYEGWLDMKLIRSGVDDNAQRMTNELIAPVEIEGKSVWLPAGSRVLGSFQPSANSWVEITERFMGAPYLWGGKSILGIDCSGLVQVVASLKGIQMPRDAKDQMEIGEEVPFMTLAESGDLAYFDNAEGKIIHVGIIEKRGDQDYSIIHAAGEVRKDRVDQQGIFREDWGEYTHQLRIVKRI